MVNAACVEGEALQLLSIFICSFTTAATLLCVYTNVSSHECHTHTHTGCWWNNFSLVWFCSFLLLDEAQGGRGVGGGRGPFWTVFLPAFARLSSVVVIPATLW